MDINKSVGYIDLAIMKVPNNDHQYMITDRSVFSDYDKDKTGKKALEDQFNDIFVFDVTSGNSIVSNLDMSFSIPGDNIANMFAIEAGSNVKSLKPYNRLEDEAVATSEIHNITENSSSAYPIDYYATYLPIIEEVDLDQLLQKLIIKLV